jgi:hypothetical protein
LLASLYEAALTPDAWPAAMSSASAWIGGSATVLLLRRTDGLPGGALASHGFDPSYIPIYQQHYAESDPHLVHIARLPLGKSQLSEQVVPRRALQRTGLFHDILAPHCLFDSRGVLVFRSERWAAVFSAFAPRRDVLGAEAGGRMESLVPHLERALALSIHVGPPNPAKPDRGPSEGLHRATTLHVSRALELLDPWENGWDSLFESADAPLMLRGSALRARSEADDERLRRAVRLGCDGQASVLLLRGGNCALSLCVAPGPRVSPFSALRSARLMVARTELGPISHKPAFRTLPARLLAVAERMARGQSDKQIAAELEMGLATARTYASRVLRRLGISSRRELMQLEHRSA